MAPAHVLEVQGAEEEGREQAAGGQAAHDARSAQAAQPQDRQRHHRAAYAQLGRDEGRQQGRRGRPEPRLGLDDRVHADHQRGGDQKRAENIDALAQADALGLLDQCAPEHPGHDPDRHVDEEDPVPVDRADDRPAEQQPERAAADRHERVDAHRGGALGRSGELRGDDRHHHGRAHGSAQTLHEARGDQRDLAVGYAAGGGRGDEEYEAGEEDSLAPDQVAEPPAHEQEAPVADHVAVHDPGQSRLAEMHVALDRR